MIGESGKAILSEGAIMITEWYVAVSGRKVPWSDLGFVRIVKPSEDEPMYQLRVAKKGRPAASARAIFRTDDTHLVARLEQAIDEVARRREAAREI